MKHLSIETNCNCVDEANYTCCNCRVIEAWQKIPLEKRLAIRESMEMARQESFDLDRYFELLDSAAPYGISDAP